MNANFKKTRVLFYAFTQILEVPLLWRADVIAGGRQRVFSPMTKTAFYVSPPTEKLQIPGGNLLRKVLFRRNKSFHAI